MILWVSTLRPIILATVDTNEKFTVEPYGWNIITPSKFWKYILTAFQNKLRKAWKASAKTLKLPRGAAAVCQILFILS